MSEQTGEKTEEPTQKKIDDARKQGQVWKSRDLSGVMVFVAGMGVLKVSWGLIEAEFTKLFQFSFDRVAHPQDLTNATFQLLMMAVTTVLMVTLPVVLAGAAVGSLVEFLQVGPLLASEAILPKLEKLNPVAGLKNMFSRKQLVEMLKSIIKIGVAGYVVYGVVRDALELVVATIRADAPMTMTVLGELVFRVTVRVGLLFLLFAVFDVWFQHRNYRKDLMMTKDEIKREYKESEGDPHIKAKRRELMNETLENAQHESVKDADGVISNKVGDGRG